MGLVLILLTSTVYIYYDEDKAWKTPFSPPAISPTLPSNSIAIIANLAKKRLLNSHELKLFPIYCEVHSLLKQTIYQTDHAAQLITNFIFRMCSIWFAKCSYLTLVVKFTCYIFYFGDRPN